MKHYIMEGMINEHITITQVVKSINTDLKLSCSKDNYCEKIIIIFLNYDNQIFHRFKIY